MSPLSETRLSANELPCENRAERPSDGSSAHQEGTAEASSVAALSETDVFVSAAESESQLPTLEPALKSSGSHLPSLCHLTSDQTFAKEISAKGGASRDTPSATNLKGTCERSTFEEEMKAKETNGSKAHEFPPNEPCCAASLLLSSGDEACTRGVGKDLGETQHQLEHVSASLKFTKRRHSFSCFPVAEKDPHSLSNALDDAKDSPLVHAASMDERLCGSSLSSSCDLNTAEHRASTGTGERLLVVANRLPMTVIRTDAAVGGYTFAMSSGGLVSGLRGIKGIDFIWIGWPGTEVAADDRAYVTQECQACGCNPVYLDQGTIDLFYNGFCNNVLWPLIHYIPPPMEVGCSDTYADQWNAYYQANMSFVEAILEVYDDNDLVWVHDYHLMLVPKLLRARKPEARIGWFLHTPFPSQEIFRMLPYRTELLTGLLCANLVGFHVYDYLRHFISSCVQLLGLENTAQGIDASPVGGVFVYCAAIPIGIETEQFTKMLKDANVIEAIRKLKAQFAKRKVILGVDRLDYMKGLPHKLNAFDRFLELHPEWNERCVLVQLAVPSRTVVPEYQRLKSTVHELVGMINGKRGNLTHVPVHYLDQSLSLDELVALYRVADVALISSIRDGMNLVAYEFIACQAGKHGVLILSEFTGAAQSLGAGSIRINPWNLDETANAIYRALSMSKAERRSRHDYALNHVHVHTSQKWAEVFIESLRDASERNEEVRASVPSLLVWDMFLEKFVAARRRLILVDLVDALIPARGNRGMPLKKFKNLIHLPQEVLDALNGLSADPNTIVIVTTAHPSATLERIFANTSVCLAAEKGCVYRTRRGEWVRFIEERYTTNFPGAAPLPSNSSSAACSVSNGAPLSSTAAAGVSSSTGKSAGPNSGSVRACGTNTNGSFTATSAEKGGYTNAQPPYAGGSQPATLASGNAVTNIVSDWSAGVKKIFDFFERRTPGSYTECTTGTLTWYWDDTLPDFGKQQSRDLLVHLYAGPLSNTSSADVEVVVGPRFIEVRSPQCSRSKLLLRILETEFALAEHPLQYFDFVVCIANLPRRDEDVYALFEPQSIMRDGSLWSDASFASSSGFAAGMASGTKDRSGSFHRQRSASVKEEVRTEAGAGHDGGQMVTKHRDSTMSAAEQEASKVLSGHTAQGGSIVAAGDGTTRFGAGVFFSITVGSGISRSKYRLLSPYHVQALVRHMALHCGASHETTPPVQTPLVCAMPLVASPTSKTCDEDLWRRRLTPQLGIIDDALSPDRPAARTDDLSTGLGPEIAQYTTVRTVSSSKDRNEEINDFNMPVPAEEKRIQPVSAVTAVQSTRAAPKYAASAAQEEHRESTWSVNKTAEDIVATATPSQRFNAERTVTNGGTKLLPSLATAAVSPSLLVPKAGSPYTFQLEEQQPSSVTAEGRRKASPTLLPFDVAQNDRSLRHIPQMLSNMATFAQTPSFVSQPSPQQVILAPDNAYHNARISEPHSSNERVSGGQKDIINVRPAGALLSSSKDRSKPTPLWSRTSTANAVYTEPVRFGEQQNKAVDTFTSNMNQQNVKLSETVAAPPLSVRSSTDVKKPVVASLTNRSQLSTKGESLLNASEQSPVAHAPSANETMLIAKVPRGGTSTLPSLPVTRYPGARYPTIIPTTNNTTISSSLQCPNDVAQSTTTFDARRNTFHSTRKLLTNYDTKDNTLSSQTETLPSVPAVNNVAITLPPRQHRKSYRPRHAVGHSTPMGPQQELVSWAVPGFAPVRGGVQNYGAAVALQRDTHGSSVIATGELSKTGPAVHHRVGASNGTKYPQIFSFAGSVGGEWPIFPQPTDVSTERREQSRTIPYLTNSRFPGEPSAESFALPYPTREVVTSSSQPPRNGSSEQSGLLQSIRDQAAQSRSKRVDAVQQQVGQYMPSLGLQQEIPSKLREPSRLSRVRQQGKRYGSKQPLFSHRVVTENDRHTGSSAVGLPTYSDVPTCTPLAPPLNEELEHHNAQQLPASVTKVHSAPLTPSLPSARSLTVGRTVQPETSLHMVKAPNTDVVTATETLNTDSFLPLSSRSVPFESKDGGSAVSQVVPSSSAVTVPREESITVAPQSNYVSLYDSLPHSNSNLNLRIPTGLHDPSSLTESWATPSNPPHFSSVTSNMNSLNDNMQYNSLSALPFAVCAPFNKAASLHSTAVALEFKSPNGTTFLPRVALSSTVPQTKVEEDQTISNESNAPYWSNVVSAAPAPLASAQQKLLYAPAPSFSTQLAPTPLPFNQDANASKPQIVSTASQPLDVAPQSTINAVLLNTVPNPVLYQERIPLSTVATEQTAEPPFSAAFPTNPMLAYERIVPSNQQSVYSQAAAGPAINTATPFPVAPNTRDGSVVTGGAVYPKAVPSYFATSQSEQLSRHVVPNATPLDSTLQSTFAADSASLPLQQPTDGVRYQSPDAVYTTTSSPVTCLVDGENRVRDATVFGATDQEIYQVANGFQRSVEQLSPSKTGQPCVSSPFFYPSQETTAPGAVASYSTLSLPVFGPTASIDGTSATTSFGYLGNGPGLPSCVATEQPSASQVVDSQTLASGVPSSPHLPHRTVTATFKGPFESPLLSVGGVTLPPHVTYNDAHWLPAAASTSSLANVRSFVPSPVFPSVTWADSTPPYLSAVPNVSAQNVTLDYRLANFSGNNVLEGGSVPAPYTPGASSSAEFIFATDNRGVVPQQEPVANEEPSTSIGTGYQYQQYTVARKESSGGQHSCLTPTINGAAQPSPSEEKSYLLSYDPSYNLVQNQPSVVFSANAEQLGGTELANNGVVQPSQSRYFALPSQTPQFETVARNHDLPTVEVPLAPSFSCSNEMLSIPVAVGSRDTAIANDAGALGILRTNLPGPPSNTQRNVVTQSVTTTLQDPSTALPPSNAATQLSGPRLFPAPCDKTSNSNV